MTAQKQTDDRHFTHGTSASTADSAVDSKVRPEDRSITGPHARRAKHPLLPGEKPDQLAKKVKSAESRQEALLDEALEESFPSSDPVSVKRIT
ncbi:MAG: hypothetical protein JSR86_22360 [Proteobacteria bacterium]|nr:hypothetical protein [Pseudomonadota bacterium]